MDVRLLKYALRKNADRNVYIGSGEKARNIPRSPLAMPYELRIPWTGNAEKDAKVRDEKIAQYKVWLWQIMKNPTHPKHAAVWTELRKLKEDSILLCYCYPKNCHGHVIVAAWKWAVANGKIDAPRQEPPMQQTSTNAEALRTLETQARANVKELRAEEKAALDRRFPEKPAAKVAPGPLDMHSILRELGKQYTVLADAKLDEELVADHVSVCPDCDAPKYIHLAHHHADCPCEDCHYNKEIPTKPKRTTRRPRLSFDEPRSLVWNEYDDVTADLADLVRCDCHGAPHCCGVLAA